MNADEARVELRAIVAELKELAHDVINQLAIPRLQFDRLVRRLTKLEQELR